MLTERKLQFIKSRLYVCGREIMFARLHLDVADRLLLDLGIWLGVWPQTLRQFVVNLFSYVASVTMSFSVIVLRLLHV